MCQSRAYHFRCGHVSTSRLSSCRGTYADPKSDAVLCKATPSIIVSQPTRCRSCEYQTFYKDWEVRITAAHERRAAANHLLREVLGDSACVESTESAWSDDEDDAMDDYGLGFDDTQKFKSEAVKAAEEIDQLHNELRREQQARLRSSSARNEQLGARRLPKPRKRSSRTYGTSPLKEVMVVEETADDMPELDEDNRQTSTDSSDDEGPSTPNWYLPNTFSLNRENDKNTWNFKPRGAQVDLDLDLALPNYGTS